LGVNGKHCSNIIVVLKLHFAEGNDRVISDLRLSILDACDRSVITLFVATTINFIKLFF
jgi:hypothetical protein